MEVEMPTLFCGSSLVFFVLAAACVLRIQGFDNGLPVSPKAAKILFLAFVVLAGAMFIIFILSLLNG
ncbi:TPA: hypothetical protein DCP77_03595 [Candidatus Collierbacteria bacterium]|nr:hypothetical protein [Candidatus Collierbacteria bacterium]HAN22833.1 hypothetical protein [Candidatus Collierbacteria bacterium]HAS68866.1 hypothetical protein [Candidatus Collierbacteria bacterium]HBX63986.1 hypothetical protein [Candidatus Collierbacteria bacterium]HCW31245.1 hypothetical protein [Candidatus Collierbacteria bacterium]